MLIAFVSDYLPGYHTRAGGADWACRRVGELVSGHNIRVEYFTRRPDRKGEPLQGTVHYAWIVENFLPSPAARYAEVLKWYVVQLDPLAFAYFLLQFLRRRPDIVHLHRFRALTMAPIIAARLLGIPVYFSVLDYWMFCALETLSNENGAACRKFHGVWCWRCLPRSLVWLQRLLLAPRRRIFDCSIRGIKKFVVLSRSSAAILKAYGVPEEKITIIPLPYGGQFARIGPPETPEKDTLVYAGWIQKRKGLDVLLRALAVVTKEIPGARLTVIGPDVLWESQYRRSIDALIKVLGLTGNIRWLGPQPNEAVQDCIRRSEAVVVPEQWENMSPVIVGEAMFNRRPVIGSRLGGIPDFVQDTVTGLLFEASSSSDLAQKITYILKNKERAAEMGRNGRRAAEEIFSEEAIARKYVQLYS